MKELLSFDAMVAPKLITVLYYLGLVVVLLSGVGVIFAPTAFGGSVTLWSFVQGILTIAFGILFVRVTCEAWIVFFKMNEALQEIRKK